MSNKINRRSFGKGILYSCGLVGLLAVGKGASSLIEPDEKFLRPPGAEDEKRFLGTCIKCGQCVQVCPYHAVKLLDIDHAAAMGTPVIIPQERGCYLCDLLPCVLSCPSEALNHDVSDAVYVNMGKAVVVEADYCLGMTGGTVSEEMVARLVAHGTKTEPEIELAEKLKSYIGKPCTICADLCPYPDNVTAIGLVGEGKYKPEIREKCVGCGVCVELCPAEKNVFKINPR